MKISARNVLPGTVVALVRGPVSTEVTLEVAPGLQVVASITTASAAGALAIVALECSSHAASRPIVAQIAIRSAEAR